MRNKVNFKDISLKTTLTIWYIFILMTVLVFFSTLLYVHMKRELYQEVNKFLQVEVASINNELEAGKYLDNNYQYREEIFNSINNKYNVLALYNRSGKLIFGKRINKIIPQKIRPSSFYKIQEYENNKWAVICRPQISADQITGYTLLARSLHHEESTLENLLTILLIGVPLTLLIASGGGYFLAHRALIPIDKISSIAREISHSNLSRRIEMGRTKSDEIGHLIRTLNNLLKRLDDAFDREKQFTADASHELRTPISVIRAQVEEVLDNNNVTVDDYREALITIKKQIEHMSTLVGQMLMLNRADENQHMLEKEKFNLDVLIDVVMEEMANLAEKKKISIEKEKVNGSYDIRADQSLITQLLLNLIDNAIKYIDNGGKVKIKIDTLEQYIKIDVIDNGPGISEEHLKNLFERFYRVDKSRSRKHGGTGLGLAICRWIVEAHQGKITVESQIGEGTIFSILLPRG